MKHFTPSSVRVSAGSLCALAVVILLLIPAGSPARAQHEGHDMSKMPNMPTPRRVGKRKAKPGARKAQRRKSARKTSRRPVQPAAQGMGQGTHQGHGVPSSTPMPGHEGHNMPTRSAPAQGHEGHQQPQPAAVPGQPAPQTQQATPGMQHQGHRMPATQMPEMDMPGMSQSQPQATPEAEPAGPVMRLEELEQTALQNNPTLAQAEASIRAAQGRRRQAGLFPNPVVGYQGEELAFRAFSEKSEHFFFVEQTIPLGGKLGKARRVFAREVEQAEALSEGQRLRVLNSVRVLYYDALGAQRLVELRRDLARLSREAVAITQELYNVGQADKPDQLEIEIESQRAEIEMMRAENEREGAWAALAIMVGKPDLPRARLAGNLEEGIAALDEGTLLASLLGGSPEIRSAQIGVERARAAIERARAERVPDLYLRGGIGYSSEFLEGPTAGRRTGPEANVQVGVTLPIFNRNAGGIAEAEANLVIAEREQQRLQLVLRARFSSALREYRNAVLMAEKYRTEVIPRARRAYEMYLGNFRQMAAAYPQVLIAQRTLFQVEVEYARALVGVRQSGVNLRGLLLSGGLDAVGTGGERTEGERLRAGSEATGDSDNR